MGLFPLAVYVWEERLLHTVNMESMLDSVRVVWRHVDTSVSVSMGFFVGQFLFLWAIAGVIVWKADLALLLE